MKKCIIIDDEPIAIDILTDYIYKIDFLELTGSFRNSLKALHFLKNHPVDLLFLDINMTHLNGIQFLNSLDFLPLVIFTTAYSEYAVKSYDYEAVDYLLKPIEFTRFLKAVNRAQSRLQTLHKNYKEKSTDDKYKTRNQDGSILIKSGTDFHKIDIKDILYIKGTGNYLTFHTTKNKIMTLMTMTEALSRLPKNQFFRIHKSYIVAFFNIEVIEKEQVKIKNEFIPISETYRESFLDKITGKNF